jgi:hypothetical protein
VSFDDEKSKYVPYCFIRKIPVECECCGKLHLKQGRTCSKRCFKKLLAKFANRYWNSPDGMYMREQFRKYMQNRRNYTIMTQNEFPVSIPDIGGLDYFENYMADFSDFS